MQDHSSEIVENDFQTTVTYITEGFISGSYDIAEDLAHAQQLIEKNPGLLQQANDSLWKLLNVSLQIPRNDIATMILAAGLHSDSGISMKAKTEDFISDETRGQTPLHLAAGAGNSEMVKYCLNRFASFTEKDAKNRTPLNVATEKKSATEKESNRSESQKFDEVITLLKLEELSSACRDDKRRLKEAQALFQSIPTVDSTDRRVWSFFVTAVVKETDESEAIAQLGNNFAKWLIEKGLSVNSNYPKSSEGTPLHIAASAGNLPVTKFLVKEKKADLFATNDDDDKETPLDRARKELEDTDAENTQTLEDLKKVIAYLEEEQQLLNTGRKSPIIATDSPLHAERHTTPPPSTPSPTDHSPTDPGSPEDDRADRVKPK